MCEHEGYCKRWSQKTKIVCDMKVIVVVPGLVILLAAGAGLVGVVFIPLIVLLLFQV